MIPNEQREREPQQHLMELHSHPAHDLYSHQNPEQMQDKLRKIVETSSTQLHPYPTAMNS